MPDFTRSRFADVPNAAAGHGLEANIDFRMLRNVLESEHLGVSRFRIAPGFRPPVGHRHQVQEEVYVVTGGSGRFKVGDVVFDVSEGDVVRVAPTAMRAFEAGENGMELIVVGSDRPEEGDGELEAGWWAT